MPMSGRAHPGYAGDPDLFDMEVIVRRQEQGCSATITCMIRHYVALRAQVTEGHPHNADDRMFSSRMSKKTLQAER
jgi:hypothetical protein